MKSPTGWPLQFVWWWRYWTLPRSIGPFPFSGKFKGKVYKWRFMIGPLEIRKWG